jgi:hypothetical protein
VGDPNVAVGTDDGGLGPSGMDAGNALAAGLLSPLNADIIYIVYILVYESALNFPVKN